MKAMILAAGRGERMRPLTDERPKPLLKVNGKTLIEWHIEALKAAGIKDIIINTAWLGDMIPEYLGDGAYWGVKLTFSHEEVALETAGGIRKALDFFENQPFIVVNGDVWTDFDFVELVNQQEKWLTDKVAHLVLVNNPEQHPSGDFLLRDDLVFDQALNGEPRWTFSGIGLYRPQLFQDLMVNKAEPLAPLLKNIMADKQVSGQLYQGKWHDIGTPERLKALNESFSRGHKVIEYKP